MKKLFFFCLALVIGASAFAQTSIQLRSADRAECVKSDMTSLKASFSFSTIEAQDYESERGTFSWLSLPNTVLGGNVGEPQIPVVNQLIAVPFGATPRIEITSYSTTDYNLADYGMTTLVPRQLPVRKDQKPEDVPFIMNEAAYQTRGLRSEPTAVVSVEGTMRGVQLGTMTIEPVSYDPVSNTLRVFNDIEATVHFDGADRQATEDMLLRTYSPAFEPVYAQLFNNRAVTDVYTQHPDLYNTPVRMLVICYSGFEGNASLNSWLEWKLQKGYYVDIYYTGSGSNNAGTTSSAIASFIKTKYNASVSAGNAYTYLIVIGDTGQVPQYMTKTIDSDIGQCASDLGYASVNFSSSTSNYFPDMYYSRISVENTTHLTNYFNKVLTYEKYEMTDGGNYLNNVILVGGWDSSWTSSVAKPTINYGKAYYFKSNNTTYGGFENGTIEATISTSSTAGYAGSATGTSTTMGNGVYTSINSGVGFLNYTAHGDKQEWYQPKMTAAQVAKLTNSGKYFFGIGNCCLTGNFNNTTTTYSPGSAIGTNACFAETMIRVPNAGAVAYIGCSPYSYWYEDFYWAVGAHSFSSGNYPTTSASSTGVYDAMFIDGNWNSASALLYLGNLAVQQAVTSSYENSSITSGNTNNSAHYYFQFYHTFGDGSVMPYVTKPETNTVTIPSTVTPGTTSININALAGSYVAVTDNSSVIYGVAEANANGVATVNFTNAIPESGTLYVVVTRQQYQPYFGTIEVVGGTEYTISANVSPANAGTVTGAGSYYENTECTLTATANHGYAFVNWSNNSTANPLTFTVTGNASYTANFRQLTQHHFTYNPQQNHGTISVSPANAYAGDIVTLTATPDAGYCLDKWIVETVSKTPIPVVNNQFEMPDSDVTISATFKSGYTITVANVANGTITASTTSALNGETITLTATPNTGCEFSTWYVYKTGDPNTLVAVVNNSFTMPSYDVTVSAVFATTTNTTVTVGSNSSSGNDLPTNAYYKYSLTQQIYTTAELGEAGTINAIAFQVANSKAATRTLDIYMIPTTKDAFTSTTGWEVLSSVFKVYSGSVSFNASGWTTITLDTPYEYDGVKNLCVGVVDQTGSDMSYGTYPTFYIYSTGGNRAMRARTDNSAYSSVGTSQGITSYTGTYVTSNNYIQFTKTLSNAQSLTVSPDAINDFSYLMGMGPTEAQAVSIVGADLSNDITVTAPTDFEVSTSATGTYSQSVTIPRATGSKGGRTVTSWGFEGTLDNWTAIDSDGDGYGWVLGSATSNVYLEDGSNVTDQVAGHNSSTDMMVSGSWTDATTTALTPDNWLVSPQVELGGSFSLYARPFYTTYFPEHFGIYVSTTSNSDVNTFTLLGEWTLGAEDWKQYSVDLHGYQGQTGYIAVRHFNCTDNFCILVDDFELDTDAAYNPEFPVTITSASVYVRMKADLSVGDYSGNMTVASGTLSKTVALSGMVEPNGGEQYTITVNANPTEGGTVTGAGTYYEQSRVTLTATPATHYTFEGWQLNGTTVSTSASYQITVTGDATYTALFAPMTAHNVAITQPTGGAITSDLATAYAGDVVTVTYTVESGYFFVEWNVVDANSQPVEVTTSGQSGQFTMPDSDVTVTATFTTGYNVTLNQTTNGTISADQTTQLQPGDHVTLTATPDNGCVFLAWYAYRTGDPRDVVDVIANTTIIMPASDVTVQAIFVTEEEHEASLGSGTNTNNYIPTYTRAKYSLTQQIYLASELENQNGRITKIAYRANRAATRNLDIYIRHTDNASFSSTTDWTTMGPSFKVFSGNVAFSNSDFTTITLDTPFEYDGTSNIIICVVDNTNSTTNQAAGFYCYSGTNRALYAYGSSAYSNVNYSNITDYTGTRISYVNRINITMMVPGSAESLTLSPGAMDDFSYVENHGPSHTDKLDIVGVALNNDITITAPTNFEISLAEDGTYASSLTIPRETGSKNRNITTWNFDDGLGSWTIVDADGDGNNWYHNTTSGQTHNSSAGGVTSASYSGGALTPDNWLISPQVELGGTFSIWACPQDPAWPQEHFGIFVSTTDANPGSFTMLNEWTCDAGVWKQYSVDLRLYAGQTGYIAVRHFDCTDKFRLNVDDFELDTEATITIEMPVVITPATVYVRMAENLNPGTYTGTLTGAAGTFNGSISLSGEVIAEYDITVAANPAEGGSVRGAGSYAAGTEITVKAAANTDYNFVNWTENGTPVSTDAEYTFTVTADRELVANFEPTSSSETLTLANGWGWFSSPIVATDLLTQLENALGDKGEEISDKEGHYAAYYEGYGWYSEDLTSIDVKKMYKVKTNTECSVSLTGTPANPAEHPITLNPGFNWIGYPVSQALDCNDAMAGFNATAEDLIKGKTGYASYYEGYGWYGSNDDGSFILQPGQGYIYQSHASGTKTLTFASGSKDAATAPVAEPSFWIPQHEQFPDNMCVMATVADELLNANELEIAAFVNGQCRGSVKAFTIPQTQQRLALLTVSGLNGETVSFRILADGREFNAHETLTFAVDAVNGNFRNPVVLHTGTSDDLYVFPNPVSKGETFSIALPNGFENATIELVNTLGARVATQKANGNTVTAPNAAGVYTLRVSDNQGNVKTARIVVK